ncbi:MAG: GNAT family N-acetyltransferase [Firmicutes bacterium]|nr:GNAT family N-acetyltransferase [Bacillota bacterium]
MNIRPAEKDDADGILSLLVQVNNVHNAARPDLFIKNRTKYTKDELLSVLDDKNRPVFVAADNENKVAGYCFGIFQSHKEDNNFPDITTFYIDDLCVDETQRGTHIGKALYEFAKNFARENGCYNLTLNVWNGNDSAIHFYEKCGLRVQKYGLEEIL